MPSRPLYPPSLTAPLAWLAVALGCGGCAPDDGPAAVAAAPGGVSLLFAPLSDGDCAVTTNGTKQVPEGVVSLVAHWTAGVQDAAGATVQQSGKAKATKATAVGGKWEIKDIPATSDLSVQVYGCNAAKQVVYAGARDGVQIEAGKPQSAHIFLAPLQGMACTGSPTGVAKLTAPRALAGPAVLASGDVLIAGGVTNWNSSTARGDGAVAIDLYEPREGHFRTLSAGGKALQLSVGRVAPHVLPLATGSGTQALVVGGALNAKRIGDGALKLPVFGPAQVQDLPAVEAELVDAGPSPSVKASAVKTGVGTALGSSAIATGNSLLFAGGQTASGQVLDAATRVRELADIAKGGSGKTDAQIKLNSPRLRPLLLAFPNDGTVLVWGGAVAAAGSAGAASMGELVLDTNQSQPLTVTGDATLLADPHLSTIGAVAAYVDRSATSLTVLVSGGVPVQDLGSLSTAKAPTYLLTVNKADLTAVVRRVALPAGTVAATGLWGLAVPLDGRRVLLGGGLVSLSAPLAGVCEGGSTDCTQGQAWLLRVPDPLPAGDAVVPLELLQALTLGGARFGFAAAPLPMGALLAGGQQTSFPAAGAQPLSDGGAVVTVTPAAADPVALCQ